MRMAATRATATATTSFPMRDHTAFGAPAALAPDDAGLGTQSPPFPRAYGSAARPSTTFRPTPDCVSGLRWQAQISQEIALSSSQPGARLRAPSRTEACPCQSSPISRFPMPTPRSSSTNKCSAQWRRAGLEFAGGQLFLSDDFQNSPKGAARARTSVFVGYDKAADVDAIVSKAKRADATITTQPQDMFWGDRFAQFTDPFGHEWMIGAPKDAK